MTIRVTHGGNMFEHSKASAPKKDCLQDGARWLKMDPSARQRTVFVVARS